MSDSPCNCGQCPPEKVGYRTPAELIIEALVVGDFVYQTNKKTAVSCYRLAGRLYGEILKD